MRVRIMFISTGILYDHEGPFEQFKQMGTKSQIYGISTWLVNRVVETYVLRTVSHKTAFHVASKKPFFAKTLKLLAPLRPLRSLAINIGCARVSTGGISPPRVRQLY